MLLKCVVNQLLGYLMCSSFYEDGDSSSAVVGCRASVAMGAVLSTSAVWSTVLVATVKLSGVRSATCWGGCWKGLCCPRGLCVYPCISVYGACISL